MVRTPASSLGPLDHLKTALKIAAAVGDGAVNVPGLRSAAITVVEIIDIAQVRWYVGLCHFRRY
jgi:soluble P-type ATPase